ncbi:MAG: SDR family NAD(P)-dependent oxidoreductase [Anaeromyxobacteraceae bacterium]
MKQHPTLQSRRHFLNALGGAGLTAPALWSALPAQARAAPPFEVRPAPRYFPRDGFTPEVDLAGKVAVITGASRGIGLAVGRALQALGVQVIGTSRTPLSYPSHPFPLLPLDLADPASLQGFPALVASRPEVLGAGGIDILINNAGRGVVGGVVPIDPATYFAGIQTTLATLYGGHVAVTSALLRAVAARSSSGYARILFTTSVQAYLEGGEDVGITYAHGYTSAKRALLAYANGLRTVLAGAAPGIRVSTLNPLWTSTDIALGTRPILLQPVDGDGNAVGDPGFQLVLDAFRALVANGLPTSYAAQAYVQLLTTTDPEANVVVGSDVEPFASQSGAATFTALISDEMKQSAVPWVAGPRARP